MSYIPAGGGAWRTGASSCEVVRSECVNGVLPTGREPMRSFRVSDSMPVEDEWSGGALYIREALCIREQESLCIRDRVPPALLALLRTVVVVVVADDIFLLPVSERDFENPHTLPRASQAMPCAG